VHQFYGTATSTGSLEGRDLIHALFLQAFLVNDQVSVANHFQKYVRLLVMPKVPKRAIFVGLVTQCVKEKGRLLATRLQEV
jgi:inhibitor of KinA sporulation pathway (predicted exonuclease)